MERRQHLDLEGLFIFSKISIFDLNLARKEQIKLPTDENSFTPLF